MAKSNTEEIDIYQEKLCMIIEKEAQHRRELGDFPIAFVLRQYIQTINPNNINNLLHLVGLSTIASTAVKIYSGDYLNELGLIDLLKSEKRQDVDADLLMQVLRNVLLVAPLGEVSLQFLDACIPYVPDIPACILTLTQFVNDLAYSYKKRELAAKYTEQILRLEPRHKELLRLLATFYQDSHNFDKGIEAAQSCYLVMETLEDKIYANYLVMRGFIGAGGHWQEFSQSLNLQKKMVRTLLEQKPTNMDPSAALRLLAALYFVSYFQDQPVEHSLLRNQIGELVQLNIENYAGIIVEKVRKPACPLVKIDRPQKLKLGYISYCLRSHSVGWLTRSLFKYHDREKWEIYTYLVSSQYTQDPVQEWYIKQSDKAYKMDLYGPGIAQTISEDNVDILVDLDSLTLTTICEVMAIKPAPIQVTWLGWDASGIPSIDYFIADPYVLPEEAQSYYSEKIWRLPETYIAIDGFELAVPTLRRNDLGISSDAIVYFSIQRGYKYSPHTAKLQMQIIKEVPNSYFLIKGIGDQKSIKNFFLQIAEAEGVNGDRLKFIELAGTEAEHRANLGIADIVLDTYPYNGATTSLETLWREIPVVTRVGQQFASRNTYTMLMNAGVKEGIAWTDEEYVMWGVRLGTDANLRQQVAWKLRESKKSAPLWNARKFAREMENAYEQMWQIYQERGK